MLYLYRKMKFGVFRAKAYRMLNAYRPKPIFVIIKKSQIVQLADALE